MFKNRLGGALITLGMLGLWIWAAWLQDTLVMLLGQLVSVMVAVISAAELIGCMGKKWPRMPDEKIGAVVASLLLLAMGLAFVQIELRKSLIWCVLTVGIPAVNDSAAMIVGKILGGRIFPRKINRRISPNKTWIGAEGGVICSLGIFGAVNDWLWQWPWWEWQVIVFTLALWANIGDFLLSQLKRVLGVKDFSDLLGKGGHGGVLDRFGNYYPVALVAFMMRGYQGEAGGGCVFVTGVLSLMAAIFYCAAISEKDEHKK